jgi:WD40 repeat protein
MKKILLIRFLFISFIVCSQEANDYYKTIEGITFSPNGKFLAVAISDADIKTTIKIFNTETKAEVLNFNAYVENHKFFQISYSKDGKQIQLLYLTKHIGTCYKTFNADTGEALKLINSINEYDITNPVTVGDKKKGIVSRGYSSKASFPLSFCNNSQYFLMSSTIAGDHNIHFENGLNTLIELDHYQIPEVCNISDFSNQSYQSNEIIKNIKFDNLITRYLKKPLVGNPAVISTDNKYILTSIDNKINMFDTFHGSILFELTFNDKINSLTFNNKDSQFAFSHSNKIYLYDFHDNALISATRPPSPITESLIITVNPANATDVFKSISFSRNDSIIAGALNSGTIYIYDVKTGKEISAINVFIGAPYQSKKEEYDTINYIPFIEW